MKDFINIFAANLTNFYQIMKEENKKFLEWYTSLEGFERRYVTNQICIGCEISRPTLSRWLEGKTEIKNPYRMVINKIAGRELFDVMPLKAVTI